MAYKSKRSPKLIEGIRAGNCVAFVGVGFSVPTRIVFTCSKGLPGVGFSRPEWNDIKEMKSGTVSRTITDDTLPGGPRQRTITYIAPFDRCDREADYATAWAAFEKRELK
jgi:hypothetical protein